MIILHVIYLATGIALCIMFTWLAIASRHERKPRAGAISAIAMLVLGTVWFAAFPWLNTSPIALFLPPAALIVMAVLFYAPIGRSQPGPPSQVTEKVDERDTMFAREEYLPESEKYQQYYAVHPEYRDMDDRLRKLPELLHPGGRYYDADRSAGVIDIFRKIKALTTIVDGEVSRPVTQLDSDEMTTQIKQMVIELGADEVGIALLNPMFVYSHVGRGPEPWGAPIINTHRFAIVYTLEMDYHAVEKAPLLPTVEESARQYLRAANISVQLAEHIRSLGYPARAHISDSNYQLMLPPVARDAGLGELGRLGYLISPRYGARIRLGAVSTDLPLVPDKPVSFGVQDFCEKCLKCADNCPSCAIPHGPKTTVRGVEKWQLNVEQCLWYWRVAGTDCGLCMRVCPFSHPPTLMHNLVRAGIKRSAVARTLSAWGDDFLYGKRVRIDTHQ